MQLPTALTAPHRLLAAFTLVGALLLALLWAIVLTEVERHRAEVLRDVEQVVVLKAQLYAEATRPVLQRLDALLLDLREHWSGDPDAMAALVASRQRSTPDLPFRITVFDADGGRAFESHGSPGEPPDSAAQSRFAAHRGAPGRDALAVGAGLRAGRREIVLSRPIHAREHFIGAIEVGLAPTVFSRIHPTLGLGPAGISLIVLDDGQPLVRRPDSGLPAMAPIEALAHQTDAEPTGLRRFADASDGADRIAGLSRLPAYGWTFVAAESVDAVLAPNRTFRTVALGGAAAASLVTALLLFAACRARLTRLRALDSLAAQERMLADQRHLTRALLNTVGDLIWLKDANGVYLACNTRFEQFFGAAEHEILGKTDYDFVDAALADFFRQNDRRAMEKNGPTTNREWVRFASDGHSELLETTKTPMVDAQGRLIGVLGVGHNITDAQALQDALEASHRELLEAQAVARLGSWSLDLDSERIIWSPVAYELFGVPAGEPIDLSRFLSLIHPDDLPHVEAQWQAAMSSGSYDVEHRTIVNGE